MMKGVICYYSGTGNTKLACECIAKKLKDSIEIELFNIAKDGTPDLDKYDLVGFANWTDFWGPPYLMQKFIQNLPSQKTRKPAFVFSTFAAVRGKTLRLLDKWVDAKGFTAIAGHALRTPENVPPLIVRGVTYEHYPNEQDLKEFNAFISELERFVNHNLKGAEGQDFKRGKMKMNPIFHLIPIWPRTQARKYMGEKFVDEALCIECGLCKKICPYGAIELDPKPVFDMKKCYGCWACYNRCPKQAIYTKKFRGVGHYPRPLKQLREKLSM
jgi:ferredoxin